MIGGVAVGLASMIAPMYVGEFAPSAVRGQLGAYQQIAIIGGMTIAYFVNWGIALQGDDVWVLETGWRWMMLSLSIPAMAFFYLSFSVPESPSWLVKNGRIDEARKLLSRSAEPAKCDAMLEELATAVAGGEARAAVRVRRTRGAGGRRAVGVPAARRHQHGAVLRPGDLRARWATTWTPRSSASLVACVVNLLCHHDRGAHRRQGRPQAAADLRRPASWASPCSRWARCSTRRAPACFGLAAICLLPGGFCDVLRAHRVDHDDRDLPGADPRPGHVDRRGRRNGSRTCWCRAPSRCCSATTR